MTPRARRMTRRSLATIAVLAFVASLGFTGCVGSEAPATSVPRLDKAAFVAKASAICARTTRDLEAAGARLSPGTSEATFVRRDVAPIFRSALRKLATLRPPAADAAEVSEMLTSANRGLARLEANPASLKAPPGSRRDPFVEFGRRAVAYGIRCR
jgi:hypothetical protein